MNDDSAFVGVAGQADVHDADSDETFDDVGGVVAGAGDAAESVNLLCEEFVPHVDPDSVWHGELHSISHQLTEACRAIDPRSTDMMIESAHAVDPLLAESQTALQSDKAGDR